MLVQIPKLEVDKVCEKTLNKCLLEAEMPATYFTLDEVAKKMKSSPPKLEDVIENSRKKNFVASVTSFNPTGFRTNAKMNEIVEIFQLSNKT